MKQIFGANSLALSQTSYLSFKGDKLHVELSEDSVSSGGAAGHSHHVLLCEVHAFGWTALGALRVVPMLQSLMVSPAHADLRAHYLWLNMALENTQSAT